MFYFITDLKEKHPLVHNITNVVVTNFVANGLYAIGASPVMAYAKEEVAQMATIADAVVLNIGTLTKEQVEAMIIAGKAANEANVPVILDPVGAGATNFRTESARKILQEVNVTLIRGNGAEIANVAGEKWTIKGVDASTDSGDVIQLAENVSKQFNCTVVLTGKKDVIANSNGTYVVENGHPLLTKVTGAGCLLSAVVGAFLSLSNDYLQAATVAVSAYGIAAEKAAQLTEEKGSGSFQIEFLNQLGKLVEEDKNLAKIKKIER